MKLVQLTPDEYEMHIKNKTFRLAFIGMSNVGKSYRSRVLRDELDFFWYHVDEQIQKALAFENMNEISEWIGFPGSKKYEERKQSYLELENQYTKIDTLNTKGKNLVFDTTGSFVHLEEETINWLRENCMVVNLDINEKSINEMLEKFFKEPKPIVWDGFFGQSSGETQEYALKRCYPKLLKYRLLRYRNVANLSIPAIEMRNLSAQETLDKIKSYL